MFNDQMTDLTLIAALVRAGEAATLTEARRLIAMHAVRVDGTLVTDDTTVLPPLPALIQIGRTRVFLLDTAALRR